MDILTVVDPNCRLDDKNKEMFPLDITSDSNRTSIKIKASQWLYKPQNRVTEAVLTAPVNKSNLFLQRETLKISLDLE